jgi:hypothetical protein
MLECTGHTPPWRIRGNEIVIRGPEGDERYARVQAPHPELVNAYHAMLNLFPQLPVRPRLEFVRSLRGRGGLFTERLIVVGVRDALDIAEQVWHQDRDWVIRRVAYVHGGQQFDAARSFRFLFVFVAGRIIAHEFGHALRHYLDVWTPYPFDEEATADFWAGVLDRLRRKDRELGKAVFFAIGCEGEGCRHPSPHGRAHAYLEGRAYAARFIERTA